MVKKVAIGVAVLLLLVTLGLFVAISLQPSHFSVVRSARMTAPPAAVFALLNDLEALDTWSPCKDLDPNPKTTISEPASGKGAKFTWDGNDQIGAGQLVILESKPDEHLDVEQEFFRPFAGKALMSFTLAPEGEATEVTWTMTGQNDFMGKAMCLFIDMDAMLGKNFEQGLANIKRAVEQGQTRP